jgi:hypothetical protein
MKKQFCAFLLTFVSITTFGQVIPQGTRFIGGDLNFNFERSKSSNVVQYNAFHIGISPSLTKFTKDNFAITYSLGYSISSTGTKSPYGNELYSAAVHNISAGIYLSNYKMLSEKLGISVNYGGNISYLFNTASTEIYSGNGQQGLSLSLGAGPGVIYLLNEKFALIGTTTLVRFNVGYSWVNKSNSFNIGTGLSASPGLGIGFRYFLK